MSAAACLKLILNADTKSAIDTFHKFRDLGIVEEEDFQEASRADEKLLKAYRKINERIALRQ